MSAVETENTLIQQLDDTFAQSNKDFARAYYLFATAKLKDTYNSSEIYAKYPSLTEESTFLQLKALYDENPDNEDIKRMFSSVLGTFIGSQLSEESDAYQNLKNKLEVDVNGLGLKDEDGKDLDTLLYEDISEWLKKLDNKEHRQKLYDRMADAHKSHLAEPFIALFKKENTLLKSLGYPDVIDFYSNITRHELRSLSKAGAKLVDETEDIYTHRMSRFYDERTGHDFSEATRADISYVLNGKPKSLNAIDETFTEAQLIPLAERTFDGLGLEFSKIACRADFETLGEYQSEVIEKTEHHTGTFRRILLDVAHRSGKRSRAYVYPAAVPSEIYLSVKPEGGLDDYSAFFHESGHALHFAYGNPSLSFTKALMGNNTTTEAYAYLMQNLFLNRHWLKNMAELSNEEAIQVVQRGALNDLYMLRRYASKMQFEIELYDGINEDTHTFEGKGAVYADLLTKGCGYHYDKEGWSRDVDSGFYVADYFTAWSLEAQLREYLCKHYGDPSVQGEDWYTNPEAGAFLKDLWKDGNINQNDLSARLGYNNPNDIEPLVRLMQYNLG